VPLLLLAPLTELLEQALLFGAALGASRAACAGKNLIKGGPRGLVEQLLRGRVALPARDRSREIHLLPLWLEGRLAKLLKPIEQILDDREEFVAVRAEAVRGVLPGPQFFTQKASHRGSRPLRSSADADALTRTSLRAAFYRGSGFVLSYMIRCQSNNVSTTARRPQLKQAIPQSCWSNF